MESMGPVIEPVGADLPTGGHAADVVLLFEQRDLLARACEFVGSREAGEPCAKDDDVHGGRQAIRRGP